MITPSFSLTATERVLPKLALDFTTASLDSRVTFTRTTDATHPATYVGSDGYIANAADNAPRFDYDPITLACNGLLIEEERTNRLLNSQNITSTWSLVGATASATATTSPANDSTGNKLEETAVTDLHRVFQNITLSISTTYTFSFYAKKAERTRIFAQPSNGSNWTVFSLVEFDLDAGSVVSGTASITDAGNGWYRCSFSRTTKASGLTSGGLSIAISDPNTANPPNTAYLGVAGSGVYLWGIQLEQAAFATSYIPTTTTALTRNADVATMTGTDFSDWYNQSEGALSCEFAFIGYELANRDRIVSITDATGNEEIGIIQNSTNGYGRFEVVDGGANQALLNCINTTMTAGTTYQICGTYKVNSFCGSGSLGSQATDASGTIPTPDRMCLGGNGPGTTTAIFNGHLKSVNYWPQRITNNETLAFAKI